MGQSDGVQQSKTVKIVEIVHGAGRRCHQDRVEILEGIDAVATDLPRALSTRQRRWVHDLGHELIRKPPEVGCEHPGRLFNLKYRNPLLNSYKYLQVYEACEHSMV